MGPRSAFLAMILLGACTRATPDVPLDTQAAPATHDPYDDPETVEAPSHLPAWLEAALDAGPIPADASRATPERRRPSDFAPAWTLGSRRGAVVLDSLERARLGDGAGASVRPGTDPPASRAAAVGQGLYPGDRLETGEGDATLSSSDGALVVHLGPRARVIVPPYGGSDLVVARGVALVRVATTTPAGGRRIIDGPGARARVRTGGCIVAVADGAQTMIAALDAEVDVDAPLASVADGGDAGAPTARSLVRTALAAGHALWFDEGGRAGTGPMPLASEIGATAWRAGFDADIARPGGHLGVVREMARAGARDVADAQVLLPELRSLLVRPIAGSDAPGGLRADVPLQDERDGVENQLSSALGRALARADRGRALAARGGDVGTLFGLAEIDAIASLARVVLPIRVLDSAERRRVP